MIKRILFLIFSMALFFYLSSCSVINFGNENESEKISFSDTEFKAKLNTPIPEGERIYLEILDMLTGTAINPTRFEMEKEDDYTYSLQIPLKIGTVVDYRYIRSGTNFAIEYDSQGNQVDCRKYQVNSSGSVIDFIAGWENGTFPSSTGEISGFIYDSETHMPISEVMVYLNGQRTFTSMSGYFVMKNLPPGEFVFTAVHPDGIYKTFQQKAIIAENSITPASFGMEKADLVEIEFIVAAPEYTPRDAPIRLVGNLRSLGYMFTDLQGGSSILPSRSPILEYLENGSYRLKLKLPEEYYLKYKFSLGDGFINAEHDQNGEFVVREMIVPGRNMKLNETVESWYSASPNLVSFQINIPEYTPENDIVSIQFNPFGWMEPIPAWKTDENTWNYSLYSPMEFIDGAQYRFCRNDECGRADEAATSGMNANGYVLDLEYSGSERIRNTISDWYGMQKIPFELIPAEISKSTSIQVMGFELDNNYDKHWLPYIENGLIDAGVSGSNRIVLSPSWTGVIDPSVKIEFDPQNDPYLSDLEEILGKIRNTDMQTAVYPQPAYLPNEYEFWAAADFTYNWWDKWFESYHDFVLHFAQFAEKNNVPLLIIGGSEVSPSFSNSILYSGRSSYLPIDATDRWNALFDEIRSIYSGQIAFALPYSTTFADYPDFINRTDFLYVEIDSALTTDGPDSVYEMEASAEKLLDEKIYKLYETHQKPVILAIEYASVDGAASDCINLGSACNILISSNPDILKVDVLEQADIYQAFLKAAIKKPWISGFISRGFNPGTALQDLSSSVRGKPAMQIISYSFNEINKNN